MTERMFEHRAKQPFQGGGLADYRPEWMVDHRAAQNLQAIGQGVNTGLSSGIGVLGNHMASQNLHARGIRVSKSGLYLFLNKEYENVINNLKKQLNNDYSKITGGHNE